MPLRPDFHFSITFFPSWKQHRSGEGAGSSPHVLGAPRGGRSEAQTLDPAPALRTLPAEKMGSPLPAAGFFSLPFGFLLRLLLQLGRDLVLGFADLIQQLVEPFWRHLLARRQWP